MHFEILASLGDQSERREINYLMAGNSKFGARYLFAANIESMIEVLPPCKNCSEKLRNEPLLITTSNCQHCLSWDVNRKCEMTKYDPPLNYPKNFIGNRA